MPNPSADSLKGQIKTLQAALAQRNGELEESQAMARQSIAAAKGEVAAIERRLSGMEIQLADAQRENVGLREDIAKLQGYIQRVHEQDDASSDDAPSQFTAATARARLPIINQRPATIYERARPANGFDAGVVNGRHP